MHTLDSSPSVIQQKDSDTTSLPNSKYNNDIREVNKRLALAHFASFEFRPLPSLPKVASLPEVSDWSASGSKTAPQEAKFKKPNARLLSNGDSGSRGRSKRFKGVGQNTNANNTGRGFLGFSEDQLHTDSPRFANSARIPPQEETDPVMFANACSSSKPHSQAPHSPNSWLADNPRLDSVNTQPEVCGTCRREEFLLEI